jgi:transcriptional regulator with XRE-family HTH domain
LCKNKNITIRELANRVGIGESALQSLIKNGTTNTSTLEKISNELDVSAGIFFENSKTGAINVDHSSGVIANSGVAGDHSNCIHGISEETIKDASTGYQKIIKTYQEHSEKLLQVIDKLIEKYGS